MITRRTEDKIVEHFNTRAMWKAFRKENPSISIKPLIFRAIILEGYREIINKVIYGNLQFQIPGRLGHLHIKKSKIKLCLKDGKLDTGKLPIDWNSTNKLWAEDEEAKKSKRLVYHLNEHTEGYIHRFYWAKYFAVVKNKCIYAFEPCREAKRSLAKAIKENPDIDYYE